MILTSRAASALVIAATLVLVGCRTAPINNISGQALAPSAGSAAPMSEAQVERLILLAGAKRGWVITPDGPGKLVGEVNVRGKHYAKVDIFYDRETFSIKYNDSRNLNYSPADDVIHPNYNQWVRLLAEDITQEAQLTQLQQ